MKASPLLLETYFVLELSFKANMRLTPKGEMIEFEEELNTADLKADVVEWQENPGSPKWTFELELELPENTKRNYSYSFLIRLLGFFNVDKSFPEMQAGRLARVNGPAVLYSAAREIVATVTGRGPNSALLLPSVNFLDTAVNATAVPSKTKRIPSKESGVGLEKAAKSSSRKGIRRKKIE